MRTNRSSVVVFVCVAGLAASAHAGFTNVINIPPDPVPESALIGAVVGETTQLTLLEGGVLPGGFLVAFGGELNVNGGTVGSNLLIDNDGVVNLNSGTIGDILRPLPGGTLNINGGVVDGLIQADNATLNITGGDFPGFIFATNNSILNISGGLLRTELTNGTIELESGSTANLTVLEARVGGIPLDLELGVPTIMDQRGDFVLEGTFADGSPFIFNLLSPGPGFVDWFPLGSLSLTLVPAPAGAMLFAVVGLSHVRRRR